MRKVRQGGNQGNPGSGNHPCQQPLTGTVTLRKYSVERILTCAATHESREEGEGARIRKDSPTQGKSDPQRSAKIPCKIMQKDSGPENPKWATPHVTHASTRTLLAALARG